MFLVRIDKRIFQRACVPPWYDHLSFTSKYPTSRSWDLFAFVIVVLLYKKSN